METQTRGITSSECCLDIGNLQRMFSGKSGSANVISWKALRTAVLKMEGIPSSLFAFKASLCFLAYVNISHYASLNDQKVLVLPMQRSPCTSKVLKKI